MACEYSTRFRNNLRTNPKAISWQMLHTCQVQTPKVIHNHLVTFLSPWGLPVILVLTSLHMQVWLRSIHLFLTKNLGRVSDLLYGINQMSRMGFLWHLHSPTYWEIFMGFEKQRLCWYFSKFTEVNVCLLHPNLEWQQCAGLCLHAFFPCHLPVQLKQALEPIS